MVIVDLCSPTPEKSVEQFIDGTTRKVRKPATPCFLAVHVDEVCALIIEVDGAEIVALPLQAGPQSFELAKLLQKEKKHRRSSLFSKLVPVMQAFASQPHEVDTFSVVIRKGTPEGALIGTYNYQLLDNAQYDAEYDRYARASETRSEPAVFTTDERSVANAHDCPNCHCRMSGLHCQHCDYTEEHQ